MMFDSPYPLPLAGDMAPTSCHGCGLCCSTIGMPPNYDGGFPAEGAVPSYFAFTADGQRLRDMPQPIYQELADHYAAVFRGEKPHRGQKEPCLWLDEATGACRHYEWRPSCCRDFPVSGERCLLVRDHVIRFDPTTARDCRWESEASWRTGGGDCFA